MTKGSREYTEQEVFIFQGDMIDNELKSVVKVSCLGLGYSNCLNMMSLKLLWF